MVTLTPPAPHLHDAPRHSPSRPGRRIWGLAALVLALIIATALSLAVGAQRLPVPILWDALVAPDASEASAIVWTLRVPRTVLGIVAGVAFGVAGALIQALTRNPLADPGILGVNAGAAFAVTLAIGVFGVGSVSGYVWFALIGAVISTVCVYAIGASGRGAASPVTLVLAGVALAAVLTASSTFISLMDEETFRGLRTWGLGSIAGAPLAQTLIIIPFVVCGLALSAVIAGPLNAVALGDDLAASLGAHVTRTRTIGIVAVTLLAGAATALTGGLAFIGLMVPHIVRWWTGPDQRWILAGTAVGAPSIVLAADVVGRVIAPPGEVQAGVLTAIIGAPILIALVRRRESVAL